MVTIPTFMSNITLSNEEEQLLRARLDEFQSCRGPTRGSSRTRIVAEVYTQILKFHPNPTKEMKTSLKNVCNSAE